MTASLPSTIGSSIVSDVVLNLRYCFQSAVLPSVNIGVMETSIALSSYACER